MVLEFTGVVSLMLSGFEPGVTAQVIAGEVEVLQITPELFSATKKLSLF